MTKAERQNVWTARVAQFRASGQSLKAWCTDHDVKPYQLRYWLKKEKQVPAEKTLSWLPLDLIDADFQPLLLVRVGRVAVEVRPALIQNCC